MGTTRMADQVGRVLGDRYRLLAPIGAGASGHVFLADDVRLRRRVAVKLLHPALAGDEAFLRRFRAEAHAAAALNHPNVMAVFDWGEEEDGPYLVCEFLGGGSLRSMLDNGRRLSVSQALLVGLQAAQGLDYAHRRGLVHRDIKPANLLFDDDSRLRIADFGLARALAEAAWTEPLGAVLGTARYASPEQVNGAPLDGKADVYSLAVLLVEAVTGTVPFSADTTVATLMARLDRPLEGPPELGPMASVITRAGRTDPGERLDAAAMATALQLAAAELPSPAPLPLAGLALVDEESIDRDITELGRGRGLGSGAPIASGASGASGAGGAGGARPGGTDETAPVVGLSGGTYGSPVPPAFASGSGGAGAPARPSSGAAAGGHVPGGSRSIGSTPGSSEMPFDGEAAFDATGVMSGVTGSSSSPRPVPRPGPVPRERIIDPSTSPAGRRRRRRWPYVLLVVLLLAAGGGGAFAIVQARIPSHPLPDVRGQARAEAEAALVAFDFDVVVAEEFLDSPAAGLVAQQDPVPAPGTKLKEGSNVRLVVSKGPPPTAVPDLTGMDQPGVTQALAAVGHVLGKVTSQPDEQVAAGKVLDWTMKGEVPPKGATVDVVLSSGPRPRDVPNLVGLTYDQAVAALGDLGLKATKAESFSDDDEDKGQVTATNPKAGAKVSRDSSVTVSVSKGQPVVPDLNGLTADAAAARLDSAGLKVGNRFGPATGKVFLTVPAAGTKTKPGAAVNLYTI